MTLDWKRYRPGKAYDELLRRPGRPRPEARQLCAYLAAQKPGELAEHRAAAERALRSMGITFTVYGKDSSVDRVWPLDLIPRIIRLAEWKQVAEGLRQRLKALNRFIDDVYNERRIVKDGVFPEELLQGSKHFLPACQGVRPPRRVWAHVCGTDLIRDEHGTFRVLEDNLRIPSGVSYVLENRYVMKRTFPEIFQEYRVEPVDDYPTALYDTLASASPRRHRPRVAVLTPGVFNAAYYEHSFLAQQMGVELVEGRDLFVGDDDCLYMRTIEGPVRVDALYRRVDDAFLDPEVFRPDSALGVPGLMRAWKAGKVALCNAPGAGVADDKCVYPYVPDMIRYYLRQKPMLQNVRTWQCRLDEDRAYVLDNIADLVVKPASESGGYGMLIGPQATAAERERFRRRIRREPRNYVAQPLITLSTAPTFARGGVAPRHLDLRPFALQGRRFYVTPGGLTRVALREGSYVVNSSQGGGSKDTWVVDF